VGGLRPDGRRPGIAECDAAVVRWTEWTTTVAETFDVVGAGILVAGFGWSIVVATRVWRADGGREAYRQLRSTFGGALLLALEVLVAADLVRTVTVAPTAENVLVLGMIVLIRTFLSFSLQVEMDGTLPWRRSAALGASAPRPKR
jgi:uncharacterized membrane protein